MESILEFKYFNTDQDTFNSFNQYINNMNNTNKQANLQILYVCDALYLQKKM